MVECSKTNVDLSLQDLKIIENALATQEKILTVQNRARHDATTRLQLNEIKGVIKTLRRRTRATPKPQGFGAFARALFS